MSGLLLSIFIHFFFYNDTATTDIYTLSLHDALPILPVEIGFTWVLVGAPIALVVGALLLRLVLSLPRRATLGVLLGGALFLTGAVGIETINGRILVANDMVVDNAYIYSTMVEELLEMSGVAVALSPLVSLIQYDAGRGVLRLDPAVQVGRVRAGASVP